MIPQLSFERSIVTLNRAERVHALVEFTAPPAPPVERPAIDVVFVIDSSGSMHGRPLESVRHAVAEVLRHLAPTDRAGVVTFDSSARLVVPIDQNDPAEARRRVLDIRTGGNTNLSAGWLMAHEMLRRSQRDATVRRIVVLTDGHINQGVVEADELATMVAGGRQIGVSTSFIGFSEGYQEALLGALANAGGGNDYWCEGADAAGRVFMDEFDGLARVVVQNVSITVTPSDAVAHTSVLNDFAVTHTVDGVTQVDLGDAFGGEQRSVLFAFDVRAQQRVGAVPIAHLRMSWVSTVDGFVAHEHTIPIEITATEEGAADRAADPRVAGEVVLLVAARNRREARRLADAGEFERAIELADSVAVSLSELPNQSDAFEQSVQELEAMRSRSWDRNLSKQAFSSSRQMSRKRQSQFRSEPPESGRDGEGSSDEQH